MLPFALAPLVRRTDMGAMRFWAPRTVLVTPSAAARPDGAAIVERAAALGAEVVRLGADRLLNLPPAYRDAKRTLAVIEASPSRRRLQAIPPSADWRFDLAEGCPAHCTYCYLAGSLSGPPITRVYANIDDILGALADGLGAGRITSRSAARAGEGTTFECSCYTDPLAIEHLTGHLARAITHFGAWDAAVELRFTTKFDAVEPLLALPHRRRTRVRFSVNARDAERHEGGAPPVARRLAALRLMAGAGYKVGLTVAPILRLPGGVEPYAALFRDVAAALDGAAGDPDLTAELITHRFTPKSRDVLQGWYPGSALEMDEARRQRKTTRFGSTKFVFPRDEMTALRDGIEAALARELPGCRVLYWT